MNSKKIWMLSMIIASIFTLTFYIYLSKGADQQAAPNSGQENVASAKKDSNPDNNSKTETPNTKEMLKINPDKRAISIAVDHVKGVSGLIRPGNIVDIIAFIPENAEGVTTTEILLQEIKVLAVGSNTTGKIDPAIEFTYPSVTVEVTPEQAVAIATVSVKGSLTFMLRKSPEPKAGKTSKTKSNTNTNSKGGTSANDN